MDDAAGVLDLSARASALAALERSRHDRLVAALDLPAGPHRVGLAADAVAVMAEAWGLSAHQGRRWLAGAREVLDAPHPVELFLQLDRISSIVSLELWTDGVVVFGIDDWVGF